MTDLTVRQGPDIASDTLKKSVEDYLALYALQADFEEPDRPSSGLVAAVASAVADGLDAPAGQLSFVENTGGWFSDLVEGRTFRLGISPGIIRTRSTDVRGRDVTEDGAGEKRSRKIDTTVMFAVEDVNYETGEIFDPGLLPDFEDGPSKKEIREWSARSRSNMTQTLASLDYSDWSRADGELAMVTFTLPDQWEILAPDGKAFKRFIEVFRRRWVRAVKTPWRLLWKLEFQRRGAPHYHALMRVPALVDGQRFEDWLSATWASVVGASTVADREDGSSEYSRHVKAGTGVDFSGKDFSDPRRISMYFAGHSAKTQDGKEYQHRVPELWQAPGKGPGRFWGFSGLVKAYVELDVTQRDYDRLRREQRKMARARAWEVAVKRQHGREFRAGVQGKDFTSPATIRAPKVRRSAYGGGGGQNGGWCLLNDALAVVRQLSAWLPVENNGSWDGLLEPSVVVPGWRDADRKRVGSPRFSASDGAARFWWDQEFSRLCG